MVNILNGTVTTFIDKVNAWRNTDLRYIEMYKTLLFYQGLWPKEDDHNKLGAVCRRWVPRFILCLNMYLNFFGNPLLTYNSWGQDIHLVVESIAAEFVSVLVFLHMHWLLWLPNRKERLFRAFEEMRACRKILPELPVEIIKQTRRITELILGYVVGMTLGLINTYTVVPKLLAARETVYHAWYPFDYHKSPFYEVVFTITIVCQAYSMCNMLYVNALIMCYLTEAIGEFRLLNHNFDLVCKSTSQMTRIEATKYVHGHKPFDHMFHHVQPVILQEVPNMHSRDLIARGLSKVITTFNFEALKDREEELKLKSCIVYHESILRFVNEIQASFNPILFQQLFCSLIPTGLAVVLVIFAEAIEEKTIMFISLALACNVVTALLCWLADKVTKESALVRDAVYCCGWAESSEGFKRSVRIIMSRSNQPVVIKVARIIPLTMETFYATVKLTYSYTMTLITQINQMAKLANRGE